MKVQLGHQWETSLHSIMNSDTIQGGSVLCSSHPLIACCFAVNPILNFFVFIFFKTKVISSAVF